MEKTLTGQAEQTQIDAWKEKHNSIFAIKAGDHITYFREPEIADLNIASAQTTMDNPLNYWVALFRELRLGGSEEVVARPSLFMAYVSQMRQKVEGVQGELVNL